MQSRPEIDLAGGSTSQDKFEHKPQEEQELTSDFLARMTTELQKFYEELATHLAEQADTKAVSKNTSNPWSSDQNTVIKKILAWSTPNPKYDESSRAKIEQLSRWQRPIYRTGQSILRATKSTINSTLAKEDPFKQAVRVALQETYDLEYPLKTRHIAELEAALRLPVLYKGKKITLVEAIKHLPTTESAPFDKKEETTGVFEVHRQENVRVGLIEFVSAVLQALDHQKEQMLKESQDPKSKKNLKPIDYKTLLNPYLSTLVRGKNMTDFFSFLGSVIAYNYFIKTGNLGAQAAIVTTLSYATTVASRSYVDKILNRAVEMGRENWAILKSIKEANFSPKAIGWVDTSLNGVKGLIFSTSMATSAAAMALVMAGGAGRVESILNASTTYSKRLKASLLQQSKNQNTQRLKTAEKIHRCEGDPTLDMCDDPELKDAEGRKLFSGVKGNEYIYNTEETALKNARNAIEDREKQARKELDGSDSWEGVAQKTWAYTATTLGFEDKITLDTSKSITNAFAGANVGSYLTRPLAGEPWQVIVQKAEEDSGELFEQEFGKPANNALSVKSYARGAGRIKIERKKLPEVDTSDIHIETKVTGLVTATQELIEKKGMPLTVLLLLLGVTLAAGNETITWLARQDKNKLAELVQKRTRLTKQRAALRNPKLTSGTTRQEILEEIAELSAKRTPQEHWEYVNGGNFFQWWWRGGLSAEVGPQAELTAKLAENNKHNLEAWASRCSTIACKFQPFLSQLINDPDFAPPTPTEILDWIKKERHKEVEVLNSWVHPRGAIHQFGKEPMTNALDFESDLSVALKNVDHIRKILARVIPTDRWSEAIQIASTPAGQEILSTLASLENTSPSAIKRILVKTKHDPRATRLVLATFKDFEGNPENSRKYGQGESIFSPPDVRPALAQATSPARRNPTLPQVPTSNRPGGQDDVQAILSKRAKSAKPATQRAKIPTDTGAVQDIIHNAEVVPENDMERVHLEQTLAEYLTYVDTFLKKDGAADHPRYKEVESLHQKLKECDVELGEKPPTTDLTTMYIDSICQPLVSDVVIPFIHANKPGQTVQPPKSDEQKPPWRFE